MPVTNNKQLQTGWKIYGNYLSVMCMRKYPNVDSFEFCFVLNTCNEYK